MVQKFLGCWEGFPAQLEGGLHAGCGRLQRLLVVPHPRRWRRQAMQRMEGPAQGLFSLPAIKGTELASRKGSVICQFLLKARQGDPEK